MSKALYKSWTREELILAINLYCKTPFGKIHYRNPKIIELANVLGRSHGSVSYKLANFASIDPSLERKGASNYSKLDKETWEEFFNDWDKMAFESEQKLIKIYGESINLENEQNIPEGKTKESIVKTRVNQSFFRQMILTSYDSKCCITGLPIKELLVASHIIPWSQNSKTRIDPQNGLCLNSLHDKAFDQGYITINTSYQVVISSKLEDFDQDKVKLITNYKGVNIKLPHRFLPKQEYLNYHRENIFRS
jgi:putative restriction endonuclease